MYHLVKNSNILKSHSLAPELLLYDLTTADLYRQQNVNTDPLVILPKRGISS